MTEITGPASAIAGPWAKLRPHPTVPRGRGTLAVGQRASATAVIGFQLHHPLPIDGDTHAVATTLRPCRPGPPRGRRLEG